MLEPMKHSNDTLRLVPLTIHSADRGDLFALEDQGPLPFKPVRVFVLRKLNSETVRARHAVSCDEFIVLLSGRCQLTLKSLSGQESYELAGYETGIHVPAGIWIELSDFSDETIVLVACSEEFKDTTYVQEPQI